MANLRMTLTINEDGTDHTYECANGFVARVVSAVHADNFADARRVCAILNRDAAGGTSVANLVTTLAGIEAAALRGNGPYAREHDREQMQTIGKVAECAVAQAKLGA